MAPVLDAPLATQVIDEGALLELPSIATFSDVGFPARTPVNGARSEELFTFVINWGDASAPSTGDATVNQLGSPGVNEVQTLLLGNVTDGNFKLRIGNDESKQTGPIAFNPDADLMRDNIESALNSISGFTIRVTGDGIAPWRIVFSEPAFADVAELQVIENALVGPTPTIQTATDTEGQADPKVDEVQTLLLENANTGDFKLRLGSDDSKKSTSIAFSSDPNTMRGNIETALNSIPGITVFVSGDGFDPWRIAFSEPAGTAANFSFVATDNGNYTLGLTVTDRIGSEVIADDFEAGVLGASWTSFTSDTRTGRIRVSDAHGSADAAQALLMDSSAPVVALQFDGVDDFVATSLKVDQSQTGSGATFEAWVRPGDRSGQVNRVFGTNAGGVQWGLSHNGTQWIVSHGATQTAVAATAATVDFDTWQHVAVVFDPVVGVSLVKDGSAVSVAVDYGLGASDAEFAIGRFGAVNSDYFGGSIDEVRVWSRPLLPTEIAAQKDASLSGDTDSLAAYWPVSESSGAVTADQSGNDHGGDLGGGNAAAQRQWLQHASDTWRRRCRRVLVI